jgi:hypothetical protein
MDSHEKNFEAWYARILEALCSNPDAGLVILMVAFPLLERYLRQKSGVHEGTRNATFHKELASVFPELKSQKDARKFWHVYRNGLLHQVTFSKKNRQDIKLPDGWLSNVGPPISIDGNGDFWLHPSEFAKRVIDTIQKDFPTFEGQHSAGPPLPTVHQFPTVLGTGVPNQRPRGWPEA